MKKLTLSVLAFAAAILLPTLSRACTNVIVTNGASSDGSNIVTYAADSHWLFGELYFHPAADWKNGSVIHVYDWDGHQYRGDIPQVSHTYKTVGNMNEYQLVISETTWGGRFEQVDTTGIMDYGSLIYTTLQRAKTAPEAIRTIVDLANAYGYPSGGETFTIADKESVWIMELVGKGPSNRGIVWVARRIPDGYVCAHANQARITRFPLNDPETLYSEDVISFAREKGYFSGKDEDFSFRDAYCPLDFGAARGCDARVWSAFNILCEGSFSWEEDGRTVTRPASDYLRYAMGYDLGGELPLWVKPQRKINVKTVADVMRDHYEGTPMDMRTDIGAGGNECPYRWRPMEFEYEGKTYVNERAIATQQTGFWFVAQSRPFLPDQIGALLWFGTDDAATSYLTPVYVGTNEVPECLREGNGSLLDYSESSSFWINNRISNSCYRMYNQMEPVVRARIDAFENEQMSVKVPRNDARMLSLGKPGRIGKELTRFTVETARKQFESWVELEKMLTVKFIDGNVKAQNEDGSFRHSPHSESIPDGLEQPGYNLKWKEAVVKDHGPVLEVR
ncbi:MAG: C69 family dipeptidase [Bacteroidales bacterium]|nr:C69 family dipeptidase [Bacteroidales bacterium]